MAVDCSQCGIRSELDAHFARVRVSLSRRVRLFCPRCALERGAREEQGVYRWGLAALVAGLGLVLGRPDWPPSWLVLYSALISLLGFVAVLPHEAGHGLAARLLGLRLSGVILGSGPVRRRSRVLGVPVEWRTVLAGGLTLAAPARAEGARWRMLLLLVAGPASNAALAAWAWPLLPGYGDWQAWRQPGAALAVSWVAANILLAAVSLVPMRHGSGMGPVASDGLLIWQALRAGPDTVRGWLVGCFHMQAAQLRSEHRFDAALAAVEEGLRELPGDAQLTSLLGVVLTEVGRSEEAHALFRGQLATDLPEPERAVTLSNVAWCDFLSGRDELLDEAEQCSEEALRLLAWLPPVQGTRGAVLVWSGRAAEALPLLRQAFEGAGSAEDRACVACVQAMAHHQRGELDQAKHYLERARSLDPACPLLERAGA